MTFSTNRPLASIVADSAARRLDIKVLEGQGIPDPKGVFLANGAQALLGEEGVIWQDTPTGNDPSLAQRARDASYNMRDVLRADGLLWGGVALAMIGLIFLIRWLIAGFFRRRAKQ